MDCKENFEKEFQDAFRDAEVRPDDRVWTGIELELEKADAARSRKRLLFYQWLAAASLVFAAGTTAIYLYFVSRKSLTETNTGREIASGEIRSNDSGKPEPITGNTVSDNLPHHTTILSNRSTSHPVKSPTRAAFNRNAEAANQNGKKEMSALPGRQKVFDAHAIPKPGPLVQTLKIKLPDDSADPGALLLARLADEERKMQQAEKKTLKEKLWTSVGFGAGTFHPNVTAPPSSFSMTSVQTPSDPGNSAGPAYSVGAQVGYRLGKRLVVQGGFAYLNQQAYYTSSTALMEAASTVASLNEFADREKNLIVTSPYEIAGSMQYMSVPIQAGFILIDRDFSWMINAGLATDFFIQSVLTPENTGYGRTVITSGDDSPYRPVYFAGLAGTELSYRFAGRYRIALAPGFRYALQSIYKSDVTTGVMPVTYDVSLRFRYIFQ
jgi:hypothetical protein